MIAPWIHPPVAHQQAFTAKFGPAPASPFLPASESGVSVGAFTPHAVQAAPIHERTSPKRIKTFVHSGVTSPGMGGAQQNGALSPGLNTAGANGPTSLGQI